MKNSWNGIKNLISLKTVSHSSISFISNNNKTVTSPSEITNNQQLFLKGGSEYTVLNKILFKKFHEFFSSLNINFFSLTHWQKCDKLYYFSPLQSSDLNSIPMKILKLTKNDISIQLLVLFKLSLSSDSFSAILKTSKVTPIYKKSFKT